VSETPAAGSHEFTRQELLGYLAEVDAELPAGEPVRIAVIGGAAVMFLVPGRVTDDVDVVSEDLPEVFRTVAERVGRRHGLRSDWVNDAAKGGLPRLPTDLEAVYRGARLEVYRTSCSYLLATKLHAGRAVDLEDAVPLAAAAGLTTKDQMLDLVQEAYPQAWLTPSLQYRIEVIAGAVAERLQLEADQNLSAVVEPEPPGLDI